MGNHIGNLSNQSKSNDQNYLNLLITSAVHPKTHNLIVITKSQKQINTQQKYLKEEKTKVHNREQLLKEQRYNELSNEKYLNNLQQYKQKMENVNVKIQTCGFESKGIRQIKYQKNLLNEALKSRKLYLKEYHYGQQKAHYCLYISQFQIDIKARFINATSQFQQNKSFCKGGYGHMFNLSEQIQKNSIQQRKQNKCLKVIYYKQIRQKSFEITRDILTEVAIAKLAGEYGIGPEIFQFQWSDNQKYDVLIFNDCICFKMQKLKGITEILQIKSEKTQNYQYKQKLFQKIQEDLLDQVFKLHKLSIVHRDIKVQNVLYREKTDQFILCDFGISHAIYESKEQKTKIPYIAGTVGYMSKELVDLLRNEKDCSKQNYLNFYLNDFHAYNMTLFRIHNTLFYQNNNNFYQLYRSHQEKIIINTKIEQLEKSKEYELQTHKIVFGYNCKVDQLWQQVLTTYEDTQKKYLKTKKKVKYSKQITEGLDKQSSQNIIFNDIQKFRGLKYNHSYFFHELIYSILSQLSSLVSNQQIIIENSLKLFHKHITSDNENSSRILSYATFKSIFELAKKKQNKSIRDMIVVRAENQFLREKQNIILTMIEHELEIDKHFKFNLQQQLKQKLNRLILRCCKKPQLFVFLKQFVVYTVGCSCSRMIKEMVIEFIQNYFHTVEQINQSNYQNFENIVNFLTLAAYESIKTDTQISKSYYNQAYKFSLQISKNVKEQYYSYSGIIQLTSFIHIYNSKQINSIVQKSKLLQKLKQTLNVIICTYGKDSYYYLECCLIIILLGSNVDSNPFEKLFQITNYDFCFKTKQQVQKLANFKNQEQKSQLQVTLTKYKDQFQNIIIDEQIQIDQFLQEPLKNQWYNRQRQDIKQTQKDRKKYMYILSKMFPHIKIDISTQFLDWQQVENIFNCNGLKFKYKKLRYYQKFLVNNARLLNMKLDDLSDSHNVQLHQKQTSSTYPNLI